MNCFTPRTAMPFRGGSYRELSPCRELTPFVRCFWEETDSLRSAAFPCGTPVIPDLCADVIVTVFQADDGAACEIRGIGFCGVSDVPFSSTAAQANKRLLAIRFFAWTAALFSDEPLCDTANGFFDGTEHFKTLTRALRSAVTPDMPLPKFKCACEDILLERLARKTLPALVGDALGRIIRTRGSVSIRELLLDVHASERQLERLFGAYIALSPKRVASLVRYQGVWQDALLANFDVQDAVLRYSYTDQAHLLHEFRRFHGMSLGDARHLALSVLYNTRR